MNDLKIISEEDFTALAQAFGGEFKSDCTLACEIITADGEEIRRLNRETRGVDSVTDVLSFPSLDGIFGVEIKKENFPYDIDEDENKFIGSIVVCTERAKAQAEEFGHSFKREFNYLAAHGVCHLLGYDHMTDEDKAVMREKEERVLEKINAVRE